MPRKPSCDCGDCARCRYNAAVRERYQAMSPEERRALVAGRDPEKVRAADRARYERDRTKRRAAMDAYAQRKPEVVRAAKQRWVERNPEKRRAQSAVSNAIRDGRLARQGCEICGAKAHAHHDDYSKPLDVRWLCSQHHADHHKAVRECLSD